VTVPERDLVNGKQVVSIVGLLLLLFQQRSNVLDHVRLFVHLCVPIPNSDQCYF